jgi:hypothetical protein
MICFIYEKSENEEGLGKHLENVTHTAEKQVLHGVWFVFTYSEPPSLYHYELPLDDKVSVSAALCRKHRTPTSRNTTPIDNVCILQYTNYDVGLTLGVLTYPPTVAVLVMCGTPREITLTECGGTGVDN